MTHEHPSEASPETACNQLLQLQTALESVLLGQQQLVRELLTAIVAGGHVLLEGLPGLGKTHLAKGLANALGVSLGRVQCTPDLMPSDITGSEVLQRDVEGQVQMVFLQGPIFASLVLVDEINRATPRTQSALLEAMQENQVTAGGHRHALPQPFWVLATQNPIELEGTYPLPEAQLDRFLFKVHVPYPDADAMESILDHALDSEPSDRLDRILTAPQVVALSDWGKRVIVAEPVKRAAVELVLATQPSRGKNSVAANHLRYGASPRGLQAIVRAARITALFAGRAHVAIEDIERVALPALRHRVLLKVESELEGIDADTVLREIVGTWLNAH